MKKLMLIGRTGCGKTTLVQAINGETISYKKTQALEFNNYIIDTPGEYIENRALYRALIVSASECERIALVQSSKDHTCIFPPNFSMTFPKEVIGIISKIDIGDEESIKRAEKFLKSAGVKNIYKISSIRNDGIEEIRRLLIG